MTPAGVLSAVSHRPIEVVFVPAVSHIQAQPQVRPIDTVV